MYISRGAEPRNKVYFCDLTKLEGGAIKGICLYIDLTKVVKSFRLLIFVGILPMEKLIDNYDADWDVS